MNDNNSTPAGTPGTPVWLVAPQADDRELRRELFEQLWGIYARLGLRGVLKGLRMCLLYSAASRARNAIIRLLLSDKLDHDPYLRELVGLWLLDRLPGAYIWLSRLLAGRDEWVLHYESLMLINEAEEEG